MIAPPGLPSHDPLEALIREARARQRMRWLIAVALVALVASAAVALDSIINATGSRPATRPHGRAVVATTNACGITVAGIRILQGGKTVYREPGRTVHPNGGPPAEVQCSGGSIWVVWLQGGGMMQQAYFGVHSGDAGRTWRPVFTERYFGRQAPHELDSYFGPWTVRGNAAYFAGSCPACDGWTVSLYVTKDGGGTFRVYPVPALEGFPPVRVTVSGDSVTIVGKGAVRGVAGQKTATVRVR